MRPYLASDEEAHANERAIEVLAGLRNVNASLAHDMIWHPKRHETERE